jgi:hypothetical protein
VDKDNRSRYAFRNESTKDEWLTDPALISALGPFDLDPCSPVNRPWPTANKHYTIENDGLAQPWDGRVWLNPPYGNETKRWVKRMSEYGNGIALLFSRTETTWFHDYCWDKANGIFFFKKRIYFFHVNGFRGNREAMAPSCLIAYGENNQNAILEALDKKLIDGVYITVTKRYPQ